MKLRIGTGYDSHLLVEGRPLILAGLTIPYEKGLLGHSDGDAVIHAVIDAILGALALGDIGSHFPNTDKRYKDISSILLLEETVLIMKNSGFLVSNIDITVICEKPKLRDYIDDMRLTLSSILETGIENVSIKAKTNEGMDEVGRGNGIAVHTVLLLKGK